MNCVVLVLVISTFLVIGQRTQFPESGVILMQYIPIRNDTEFYLYDTDTRQTSFLVDFMNSHFSHIAVLESLNTFVVYDRDRHKICYVRFMTNVWYNPVCSSASTAVNGLAVDDVSGKIYWSDDVNNAICMADRYSLDTVYVLVDTSLESPGGVVVYPEMGLLFWTDSGTRQKIERSTLGGRERREIYPNPGHPTSLTLDTVNNRLFWLDAMSEVVKSCDIEGRRATVIQVTPGRWKDIFWYQNMLYGVWKTNGGVRGLTAYNVETGTTEYSINITNLQTGSGMVQPQSYHLPSGFSSMCSRIDCSPEKCVSAGVSCRQGLCQRGFNVTCACRQRPVLQDEFIHYQCMRSGDIYGSILFTVSTGIYQVSHHNVIRRAFDSAFLVYANPSALTKIATDAINQKMFAFQSGSKWIVEINLIDWTTRPVMRTSCDVRRFALDWNSHNLYWITECSRNISVVTYSGEFKKIVVSMANPGDFAIDPNERHLFWINEEDHLLQKSDLSGADRAIIPCSGLDCNSFTMMAIDLQIRRLFLYQRSNRYIVVVDYSGTRWNYLCSTQSTIVFMSIVQDFILYVDAGFASGIKVVSKIDGTRQGTYSNSLNETITDLTFYHLNNPQNRSGSCSVNNGGCDQICIPLPMEHSMRCLCGDEYSYDHHSGRCVSGYFNTSFLLVADQGAPALYQYDLHTGRVLGIPVVGLGQPYAVGYDHHRRQVYWSDFLHKTVNRANLDSQYQEIILARGDLYVFDMHVSGKLDLAYFSDYFGNQILVMSLKTLKISTLYSEPLLSPIGFAVHPTNRRIYVTRYVSSHRKKLFRINMDGSNPTNFTISLFRASLVAVSSSYIFVVTSGGHAIRRLHLNGSAIDYVLNDESPGTDIHGIATGTYNVYWTNRDTGQVTSLPLRGTGVSQQTQIDFKGMLTSPSGILRFDYPQTQQACPIQCSGICIPNQDSATCLHQTTDNTIQENFGDFCRVPEIEFGIITNNRVGAVVSNGTRLDIRCFRAHSLTSRIPVVCVERTWSHLPRCVTDYLIRGDKHRGCTVFKSTGLFYVYDTMPWVKVIMVGAGGGGYDVHNFNSTVYKAGDGGGSEFGDSGIAYGGAGGKRREGGTGGNGRQHNGSPGEMFYSRCAAGGSLWDSEEIQNLLMQCDNHDSPEICHNYAPVSADPCDLAFQSVECKRYGDGSVSHGAGGGGSGGISEIDVRLVNYYNQVIRVTVGQGGIPSYGPAGNGVVIIKWPQDS